MKRTASLLIIICSICFSAGGQTVNYDESKVGPYTLEDPLRFVNGKKVRNLRDWARRRQEILDIFQREMYGQMPPASDIYLELKEQGVTLAGFFSSAVAADNLTEYVVYWLRNTGLPTATLRGLSLVIITLLLSFITLIFGELYGSQRVGSLSTL